VHDLGLLRASDTEIFDRARADHAVVVTKDLDFVQLLDRRGPPPQVIWITAGNLSTAGLITLVARHWPRVVQLLEYEALVEIGGR
jgi:predicted nuclease of predicted toxin-antitoxin system